jgi:hypothetical protein
VVFPLEAQVIAIALWITHTYVIAAADVSPYLNISSAVKRSGKSLLLDLLELLVFRPWRVANPSEAVVFRKVSADHPSLLWDEVDGVFGPKAVGNEQLRALLNAGHRRGTRVPRCVGEGSKVRVEDFEVFCAKALAGIGRLPDTVADRAIRIRLQRRAKGETVQRFRYREVEQDTVDLRQWLETWAEGAVEHLRAARPAIPEELDDRAADAWEPLFAIADLAGGEWPNLARASSLELANKSDDESWGVVLLEHLRDAFGSRDKLSTEDILRALVAREDGPWGSWWGSHVDKGETKGPASQLASNLKPFEVKPKKLRLSDEKTARGYERGDLEPVWDRYLFPRLPERRNTEQFGPQNRASEQGCSVVPFVPSSGEGTGTEHNGSAAFDWETT